MKEPNYFEVISSVINKKDIPIESIKKHFAPFMVLRWVSIDPQTCHKINTLNICKGLKYIPTEDEYLYLKRVISIPKNSYLKFDKKDKDMSNILSAISNYYRVGTTTAKEYYKLLPASKLINLLEKIAQINNTYTTDSVLLDLRKAIINKKDEILNKA